jgi:hypothetical protein
VKNGITDLRNHLFETLEALKDEEKPMDVARANAISAVAGKIIDSAKVEVAFLKATGLADTEGAGTGFLDPPRKTEQPKRLN